MAFFPITVTIHVAVLGAAAFNSNPASPPHYARAGLPDWPTMTASLSATPGGGLHLDPFPPTFIVNQAVPAIQPGPVGLISRRFTLAQISPNFQMPRGWTDVYARLTGALINAAAVLAGGNAVNALAPYVPVALNPLVQQTVQWTMNQQELTGAANLARDIKQYPNVMNAHDIDSGRIAATLVLAAKSCPPRQIELVILHAAAGIGKTYSLQQSLPNWMRDGPVRFHTWYNTRRGDLIADFAPILGASYNERSVCTGWVPLFQPCDGTIVFDDAGLLPAWYIPLVCCMSRSIHRVVVTYDAAQSSQPFPEANSIVRGGSLDTTITWLNSYSTNYSLATRRLCVDIADLLGIPRIVAPGQYVTHGAIYVVAKAPKNIPLYVASPRFAQVVAFGNRPAFEMAAIQGQTVHGDWAVDLGGLTSQISDSLIYMALTRGTGSCFLVLPSSNIQTNGTPTLVQESYGASLILSAILAVCVHHNTPVITGALDVDRVVARAVQQHMSNSLPVVCSTALGFPPDPPTVAGPQPFRRSPLGTPSYFPALPLYMENTAFAHLAATSDQRRGVAPQPVQHDHSPRREAVRELLQHRALVTNETLLAPPATESVDVPSLPAMREPDPATMPVPTLNADARERVVIGHGVTKQVKVNGSSLGLHHNPRDAASTAFSLTERYRKAHNRRAQTVSPAAQELIGGLQQFVRPGTGSIDHACLAQCQSEYLQSWASKKTMTTLRAQVDANPIDRPPDWIEVTAKGQRVKKLEARTANAKKFQMISNASHSRLFHDAVWALYLEKQLVKHLRPGVYLHTRASLRHMQRWYDKWWNTSEEVTYVDYTGWDTGVDSSFTEAYRRVLLQFGVPEEIADKFARERNNSRAFFGPMPVMQMSGDRYTWVANTLGNMMLSGVTLKVKKIRGSAVNDALTPSAVVACFSGDDSIFCGRFDAYDPRHFGFFFIPKLTVSRYGEFCGFMFGHAKLSISPAGLLHRLSIMWGDGVNDPDALRSYDELLHYASHSMEMTAELAAACDISRRMHYHFRIPPSKYTPPPVPELRPV
jgi:hypothetical protein